MRVSRPVQLLPKVQKWQLSRKAPQTDTLVLDLRFSLYWTLLYHACSTEHMTISNCEMQELLVILQRRSLLMLSRARESLWGQGGGRVTSQTGSLPSPEGRQSTCRGALLYVVVVEAACPLN